MKVETKVPHILANSDVTTIESIPRETLAGMSKPGDTQAAFEMIVARAREHDGLLRVAAPDAINYRGQLLYDESGRLRVDSREYFEGTAIEGKAPAFEGETRALSGSMNPPTVDALKGQEHLEVWRHELLAAREVSEISHAPRIGGLATTAGLAGIGALAAAYDAQATGERLGTAYEQDNPAAARSEATHFAARGVGGFAAGATPFAAGLTGGPALALAVADGVLLTEAFDRGAKFLDRNRIVFQTDKDGVQWEFTGKQWVRDDLRADLVDDGRDQAHSQRFAALPDKARELSYQASVEAVSQAIGKTDPRDPFVQPANYSDPAHLNVRDWTRDADSGRWSRTVADDVDRNDRPLWKPDPEVASPARAAELDRQAVQRIDRNIIEGPAALAMQYQIGHKRSGFDTAGDVPAVVQTALNPDTREASNGQQYRRDAQGQWSHDGEIARGNLALELDVTRERLLPALQQHQRTLAEVPAWQPPTPEEADRAMLRQAYADRGWNPGPEQFEASYLAVQRTREATGVTAERTALVLGEDANGKFSLDSPVHHLQREGDGVVRVAATTAREDIALARERDGDISRQASPVQAIPQATPEQRDVREQTQREANRQGLSQDEVQQAVAAPTRSMGGGQRDIASREQDAPRDDAPPKRADNDHTAPTPTTAAPIPPPARPTDPRDPDHPDHRLHKQIETGVAKIDADNGRTFDATSERLTMGAFHDAKAARMTSADHVVLNQAGAPQRDGSQTQGNTLLIAIQGQDPYDPAARRSVTDVKQAVEQPLEQSLQKVVTLEQQQQQTQTPQPDNPTPETPGPKGPTR